MTQLTHCILTVVIVSLAQQLGDSLQLNLKETSAFAEIVRGEIPHWVNGTLFVNGPSLHNFSTATGASSETSHYFDGLGGISSFDFRSGSVLFKSKLTESKTYLRLIEKGKYDSFTFGPVTGRTWLDQADILWNRGGYLFDNANINLWPIAGNKLITASDSAFHQVIDMETLATEGLHHEDPLGPFGAAHAAIDKTSGEIFNIAGPVSVSFDFFSMVPKGTYALTKETFKVGKQGTLIVEREVLSEVEAPIPWLLHSVGLTENYIVYRILSERLTMSLSAKFLSDYLELNPMEPVKMILLDRQSNRKVETTCNQAFSSFHIINSFEVGPRTIVVDSVASNTGLLNDRTKDTFTRGYRPMHGRPEGKTRAAESIEYLYKRCTIQLGLQMEPSTPTAFRTSGTSGPPGNQGTCVCEDLLTYPFELPVINPFFKMQRHRFVWAAVGFGETLWSNGIVKIQVDGDFAVDAATWRPPTGFVTGEPRFVPRLGADQDEEEDNGVVLVVAVNEAVEVSALLYILDGRSLEEVAVVRLPHDIPLQTHGVFFDRTQSESFYWN